LIIATLTFLALVWYAIETWRLRIAAQNQLEALAKPCLTLCARLRNASDAMLPSNDAVGNTVVRSDQGNFVVQNIGNGVALNVRSVFKSLDPDRRTSSEMSYLVNVVPGQPVTLPQPINAFPGKFELAFQFESIGGKRYRSTVTVNDYVLTDFRFSPE
jgi:hypothetical protein